MEKVLVIDQLSKTFGKLKAVDHISFEVEKGNVYGLLGPNGSGKSTTLGMLLKTILPSSGNWTWFEGAFQNHFHQKIGALLEQPNFYPHMSAYINLKIVCKIKNVDINNINNCLELVGLLERKNDRFKDFSLGMKQRLAIASAMLNQPEVLILDEPTNGLDPQGIIQIREIIQDIAKNGTTIILASHLLDEVEKVCSHVIILKNGKSLYSGKVSDMNHEKKRFEIASENIEELMLLIENSNEFEIQKQEATKIEISSKSNLSPTEINRYFAEKNHFLNLLVEKNTTLEKQFLDLIQSN